MAAVAFAADGVAFDEAHWALLVRAHAPFLRRAMARLAGAGTDDVVQEAFVSAFRRRGELPSDDGKLRGWL
ncbi:MAG TPA: sigma factor, partial [Myxococcota bacterium]